MPKKNNPEKNTIEQFALDANDSTQRGARGWGFDVDGFRVVMYAPRDRDTPKTKRVNRRVDPALDQRQEHGPAHLHVFDLHSNRESKFELIEHYDADGHYASHWRGNGQSGRIPLTPEQIDKIKPILDQSTADFVQLWREFYEDRIISTFVSRVSEKKQFPDALERQGFGDPERINRGLNFNPREDDELPYVVELTDAEGERYRMRFSDYVRLPAHDSDDKEKRRRS